MARSLSESPRNRNLALAISARASRCSNLNQITISVERFP